MHLHAHAVYVTVIAWPSYATESYMRWRIPAISFLRVFLVALPFNFRWGLVEWDSCRVQSW